MELRLVRLVELMMSWVVIGASVSGLLTFRARATEGSLKFISVEA